MIVELLLNYGASVDTLYRDEQRVPYRSVTLCRFCIFCIYTLQPAHFPPCVSHNCVVCSIRDLAIHHLPPQRVLGHLLSPPEPQASGAERVVAMLTMAMMRMILLISHVMMVVKSCQ